MQKISTVSGGTALGNGHTGFYFVPTALLNINWAVIPDIIHAAELSGN